MSIEEKVKTSARSQSVATDDVLFFDPELSQSSPVRTPTHKVSQLCSLVESNVGDGWITEGVACQILRTTGGGWKKGKIKLRLEFIPDPEDSTVTPSNVIA